MYVSMRLNYLFTPNTQNLCDSYHKYLIHNLKFTIKLQFVDLVLWTGSDLCLLAVLDTDTLMRSGSC